MLCRLLLLSLFVGTPFLTVASALAQAQRVEAGGAPQPDPAADRARLALVERSVDGAIRPAYARLSQAAGAMSRAMDGLCAAPSREGVEAARAAFRSLVRAHGAAEFVRFGPAAEENRLERLLFFPDRKGIALRQIQSLLAAKDETATRPAALAAKSVAVQGLVALEYVLAGDGSDALATPDGAFRCRYGAAVAGNVANIAAAVEEGWASDIPGSIVPRLLTPSPDDPSYRTATDSLSEVFGIFVDGLELVADLRIRPAYGDGQAPPKPNLLLFRRSGATLDSLAGNFEGLRDLDAAADFPALVDGEDTAPGAVGFELRKALRAVETIRAPLTDTIAEPQTREDVRYLLVVTGTLRKLFETDLAKLLGLSSGFSSLDGD